MTTNVLLPSNGTLVVPGAGGRRNVSLSGSAETTGLGTANPGRSTSYPVQGGFDRRNIVLGTQGGNAVSTNGGVRNHTTGNVEFRAEPLNGREGNTSGAGGAFRVQR